MDLYQMVRQKELALLTILNDLEDALTSVRSAETQLGDLRRDVQQLMEKAPCLVIEATPDQVPKVISSENTELLKPTADSIFAWDAGSEMLVVCKPEQVIRGDRGLFFTGTIIFMQTAADGTGISVSQEELHRVQKAWDNGRHMLCLEDGQRLVLALWLDAQLPELEGCE